MNLYQCYTQPQLRGPYNDTIGLIIGQRIKFTLARQIRAKLYSYSNGNPLTWQLIHSLDLKTLGIEESKMNAILALPNIDNQVFSYSLFLQWQSYISNIKGIGKWTCDALNVMYCVPRSFITNDSYIKSNVEALGYKYDANFFTTLFPGYEREACLLFWRIKKTSVEKLKNNLLLTRDDFL